MPEETPELPVSPRAAVRQSADSGDARQEVQIQAPSFLDKLKIHKFKILGGVLGVLVFAGAVFGAYKFGQRQVQPGPWPTPTPGAVATPTPDPTANWKTYTNTKYGYLIKYPKDWILRPDKQVPEQIVSFKNTKELDRLSSNLSIYSGGAHTTVPPNAVLSETKSVIIAGQEATKEVYEKPYGEEGLLEWIKFSNELKVGQIAVYKHGKVREHLDILNLMLSTFKFLEEKESAGEKVFCKDPRPEVCTMECIQNPPYICGSDGKSYCSTCQACSNPKVEWYVIQDKPCGAE